MILCTRGTRKEVLILGNKLKAKRKDMNMTIYDVAEKTHLSPTYISNLENEQKKNPSKDNMEKLARALNTTVPDLFY